jgi:hypothetical protein
VVGKLVADRIIPREYYKAPLTRIWHPMGMVTFNVIGENLFIAEFEYEEDKTRIIEGKPLIFDGYLDALADFDGLTPPEELNFDYASFWIRMYNLPLACMGKSIGEKIGSFVGLVEEVDVQEEAAGWGEYLRVKVSIELSKPLARGRMLHIPGRSIWVAFKYEKLPKFCYTCGLIYHGKQGCSSQGKGKQNAEEEEIQYGPWLRVAFPPRRRSRGKERYGGRSIAGNQFWRPKHVNSRPDSPFQRSARESTTRSDGGKDLEVQIPSEKEDHPCMEKNQTLRAKIQAGKVAMNAVRDFSMMNNGHLRKGTVTKKGQGSGRGTLCLIRMGHVMII